MKYQVLPCHNVNVFSERPQNNVHKFSIFLFQGVITESKSGRLAILADRVVDCTGDADIAFLAGAEYRQTAKVRYFGRAVYHKILLYYKKDSVAKISHILFLF